MTDMSNTSAKSLWVLFALGLAAATLLYGSWRATQDSKVAKHGKTVLFYSEESSGSFWQTIDVATFEKLNGSLKESRPAQIFWALTNHRAFDLVMAALVGLVYFIFVITAPSPEEKLERVKGGFYMAVCVVLGLQIFHFTLFYIDRDSPTLLPVDGAFRLSQLDYITWEVKDGSRRCFPGDHATVLLTITAFMFAYAGWRFGLAVLLIAIFGTLPRIVGGAHWLTDVVVGGATIAIVTSAVALCTPLKKFGLALAHKPAVFLMTIVGKVIPALNPPGVSNSSNESPENQPMSDSPASPKRSLKEYLYLTFTGICMGAADIVPGVSGGTMAFIMGIYEELLNAIKSINLRLVQLALKFKIKDCFDHVPWKFLLVLGASILVTLKLLAGLIDGVLADPVGKAYLYAFFFGLVVTSIFTLGRHVKWNPAAGLALVVGTVVAYLIVGLVPAEMPHSPPYIFFSGMIAIMAMILPGISGSFILLILGQYAYVIEALKNLDLKVFFIFGAGAAIGLLGFARVLSWLLKKFHAVTIAALIGFMTGSLRKIWPFKDAENTTFIEDRHGELIPLKEPNRLPDFSSNEWWIALALALVGVAVILTIEVIHRRIAGDRTAA
ncbi:MAG: DUF368 domain-containing protein [Verrucomicrobiota bacterium]